MYSHWSPSYLPVNLPLTFLGLEEKSLQIICSRPDWAACLFAVYTVEDTWINSLRAFITNLPFSVVDPDPNWIRIQHLCGSEYVFRIRNQTGKYRIN